jgi:cytochrome c-type biogenesis protein
MGPILFSVIAYTSQAETRLLGLFYLITYSFGIGLPFMFFALFLDKLKALNNFVRKYHNLIEKISGIILIIIGILLFFDKLSFLSQL